MKNSYICQRKLRKECNLLEMSGRYRLNVVIGYDLVSYLLHYSSARCVTFKELFTCKDSSKIGDSEINPLLFYFPHIRFSVKADWYVGTPSHESEFRTNVFRLLHKRRKGLCVKPERMNIVSDRWRKTHFFCAYAEEVLLRDFSRFSFFVAHCAGAESRPWPPVPWMVQAVMGGGQTGRMPYLTPQT